jgi:hypothetical protein
MAPSRSQRTQGEGVDSGPALHCKHIHSVNRNLFFDAQIGFEFFQF